MPGIVARIGGAPPRDQEIDALLGTLRHFPFYRSGSLRTDRGWLGWAGSGRSDRRIGTDRESGRIVAYHGDRAEWAAEPERRDRDQQIAASIGADPGSLAQRLGGSFAVACLDPQSGEFHCLTDYFGHHRLYYRQVGDTLYVSCELKGFLAWPDLPLAVDDAALRDLINYGYPLGDTTSLAEVKLLPPAAHLAFREGTLHVSRYWRPRYEPRDQEVDDARWCEEGYELFRAAFAGKSAGAPRLVLPVSGGLDSRLLLGEALAQGKTVMPYTYGHARSREAAVACDVMRRLGVEPRHIQTDDFPDAETVLRRCSWFAEGMVDCSVAHLAMLLEKFAAEPREALYVNGIYGGPTNFSNSYHKPDELVTDMPHAEKIARIGRTMFSHEMHAPGNYRKLQPSFARTCDESYDRELARWFAEHEGASPLFGHQKDAFYIANRMCRFLNQVDLNRYYWDEILPLTSVPIYEFYLRLPDRLKFGRLLHRRILARFHPQAAGAPVFASGLTVDEELAGRPPVRRSRRAQTLRYYLGRLTAGRYNPPYPEEYFCGDYVYRRNPALRRFYESVLGAERPLSADRFDFAEVKRYLRRCRRGSRVAGSLAVILGWELWLRQVQARRWDV